MPIVRQTFDDFLGYGLAFPLRRQASDFVAMGGSDLVFSTIPYILLTDGDGPLGQGEIPWDTEFGSQLNRIKFEGINIDVIQALVTEYVIDALSRCDPRLVVTNIQVYPVKTDRGNRLEVMMSLSTIVEDVEQNDVRLQGEVKYKLEFGD